MDFCIAPRLDINTPTYGPITFGDSPRFNPVQASIRGNIFARGGADISGIETEDPVLGYMSSLALGGEWTLRVSGSNYFYMFDNQGNSHLQDRSYSLVDKTCQWEVLLTQKTFLDNVTVQDLLEALAAGAETISGVPMNAMMESTALMDEYGEGDTTAERQTYAVSNSTYLAEINRVLGWFGYVAFADPERGDISILAPLEAPLIDPGQLTLTSNDFDLYGADFSIYYGGIHSDAVVASNESGKGAVCGKTVTTTTDYSEYVASNYNISKRYNPLFATTYRITNLKLLDVARQILATDRRGAQTLRIVSGTIFPAPLWKQIGWTDRNGNQGTWRVTGYEISLGGAQCQMALECIPV